MAYQFEKSGKVKDMTDEELAVADGNCAIVVRYSATVADGSPFWAYVAIKPSHYDAFMHAQSAHIPIVLEEYGEILRYGFDTDVPVSIQDEMKRRYGCDDNYECSVAEKVKAAQLAFLQTQETSQLNDIVAMLRKKQTGGS
jgi:hypothetical protein